MPVLSNPSNRCLPEQWTRMAEDLFSTARQKTFGSLLVRRDGIQRGYTSGQFLVRFFVILFGVKVFAITGLKRSGGLLRFSIAKPVFRET